MHSDRQYFIGLCIDIRTWKFIPLEFIKFNLDSVCVCLCQLFIVFACILFVVCLVGLFHIGNCNSWLVGA